MRFLVTGADGFIGQQLCATLAARNFDVRCVTRKAKENFSPEARKSIGDLEQVRVDTIGPETDWRTALQGIDVVVNLAARAHKLSDAEGMETYRSINTQGALRLAEAAAKAEVRRYVFISTIGVHGRNSGTTPFTERTRLEPEGPYAVSKWEAETGLMQLMDNSSTDLTILRPPLVYGPNVAGNVLRLLRWADRALPLPLASVRNQRSFIGVHNLSDAIIASATHAAAAGETFVLSDTERFSTAELVQKICRLIQRPYRMFPFPPTLLRLGATLLGRGADAERLLASLEVDSAKFRTALGWKQTKTAREGLAEMCEWYARTQGERE